MILNQFKKQIKNILFKCIYLFEFFNRDYQKYKHKRDVDLLKNKLREVGDNFNLGKDYVFYHPELIKIGSGFSARDRFRIEAIPQYAGNVYHPQIKIGNNVKFLYDVHIGCIDNITIGDNCLFASRIFITDHDHGDFSIENLKLSPNDRPLKSKGPVIIEENVWVGEGVAILSGVKIGKNSIIATNAVVVNDVPEYSIVGGVPARILKKIN